MHFRTPLRAARPLRWFAALTWRWRLLLLIGSLAAGGTSAYLLWQRERETRRELTIAEAWRRFDLALERDNAPAAEALLAQLADLTQQDATVTDRLAALRRGEAQAGDVRLARLLMVDHLGHGRRAEAAREAVKALPAAPRDMLIRGVLAREALDAGQPDSARSHLAAIPSPFDQPDSASPAALLLAVELHRRLGEDDGDLIAFMATRLLPVMKSRQAGALPPETRLQLLQCFHLAAAALVRYPHLAEYWAPGACLLDQLGSDPGRATEVALARESHLTVLYRLQALGRLPEAGGANLVAEFDAQVRDSWNAAHARNERDPLPYVGLALSCQRGGALSDAMRWLESGLAVCHDTRELYLVLGRLLHRRDPQAGLAFFERAGQRLPNDPDIQRQFAELAAAAGRSDRVVELCRAARKDPAACSWACRLEAAAQLDLGRPTQALEALAPGRAAPPRDPAAVEIYVRAACAVGAESAAEQWLGAEPTDTVAANVHAAAARGYLRAGRAADAVRHAALVVERFPDNAAARTVHADALRLLAEAGDAAHWQRDRVRAALAAHEWLQQREPTNAALAQRIAWLQLKGLDSPSAALRSIEPLRQAPAPPTPEMAETLGAVLLANDQAEAALAALDAAVAAAPSAPGPAITRAAALLRLGRIRAARADLDRAAALPRTPRQAAEWRRVNQDLQGEK